MESPNFGKLFKSRAFFLLCDCQRVWPKDSTFTHSNIKRLNACFTFFIINEVHISSKWKMWNGMNGILFPKVFWPNAVRKKMSYSDWAKLLKFEVEGWTYKNFEITQAIYSNSERSIKFLKQNYFWLVPIRTIKFKLEKIIVI